MCAQQSWVWGLEEQFGCSNNARKLCCVQAELDEECKAEISGTECDAARI